MRLASRAGSTSTTSSRPTRASATSSCARASGGRQASEGGASGGARSHTLALLPHAHAYPPARAHLAQARGAPHRPRLILVDIQHRILVLILGGIRV